MKKIFSFVIIVLIAISGYFVYDKFFSNRIPKLNVENDFVYLDELFIYGTHLNLHGSSVNDENLDLVLYNGNFISYKINLLGDEFQLSDKINEGINLEKIPIGTYYAFLRSSTKDEDDNDIFRYYVLKNDTKYEETKYYTFSNVGNYISIDSDNEYETLTFHISKNKDTEVYDVVIDPGHGGLDSGASKNGNKESDYTMKIADNLKKKMETKGIKVKLTRENDQLSSDERLPDYGTHGRAVIGHEAHAKYVFSIHLNSSASYVHGVEIYTADNINYEFANNLAESIVNMTGSSYSSNRINKIYDGVYTRVFTESDIKESIDEYKQKKLTAYDFSTKSNYYFMIRETGGIMTGAYVDDRNAPKHLGNPYCYSNVGSEAYLLELGYLTNSSDLTNINNNLDKYTDAIVNSFLTIFENK